MLKFEIILRNPYMVFFYLLQLLHVFRFCKRKTRTRVVQDEEPQITMSYRSLDSMSEL